ncbi:lysophospholipase [Sporolactobacillus shoreae]|uniref:Lysophospholipase n=1 Tax=Sporolactobacillus shoreae TaxID=1465501 RepID=A0A4Z0GKP2_9BACL|nr:lysophospholipase [Sporolactobacillus shoreae]
MIHLNGNPLYVAIGDSLTVGIGSTFFQPNFVKYYHNILEYHFKRPISKLVFAKNGATTDAILESLRHPDVAQAVHDASFITLTGGGNDLLHAGKSWLRTGNSEMVTGAIQMCLQNMERIIETMVGLHKDVQEPMLIRVLNLYNPMFEIPESVKWLEYYNQSLISLERFPSVRVADVYHAFKGHEPFLLSLDHTHPNPIGYRVIAQTVAGLGFDPVDPT